MVDDGPSHVGETKDRRMAREVERVLHEVMGVGQIAFTP